MEFKIENSPVFTTLTIQMANAEQFRAEAGAMVSMSPTITLEAKKSGKGLLGTMKAAVGGESFFASLFTASGGNGELILAPAALGDIVKLEMSGQTIFAQGGAYLAGSTNLNLSTQGSLIGMMSGEGMFLQKITGSGVLFLNSYGGIIEKTLAPGETYIVDTGHIVAFEESVQYKIRKASKGLFSSMASGEGLVSEYSGPGKIWMQTRNLSAFAQILTKFISTK
jgi:uncharacterized protein (TIGR00266 family)